MLGCWAFGCSRVSFGGRRVARRLALSNLMTVVGTDMKNDSTHHSISSSENEGASLLTRL